MALLEKVEQKAESALEQLRPATAPIPPDVAAKIKRGKARLKELQPRRQLCIEFTNDKHYGWLAEDGSKLRYQGTVSTLLGGKRPDHRVRRSHDLIGPMVQAKVSAATQRVPGYEVNPSTSDPEDYTAAQIAKKVVNAGYELWRVKRAFQKLVWNALVTEEGFIMAYWDSSIGPYVDVNEDPEGKPQHVGVGDVRISVFNGLEVMWEPGVDFEESRWWAVEHARPRDAVEAEPGFLGGKLPADAQMAVREGANAEQSNLALIIEYLERPSPQFPDGRRQWHCAGKQIFPEEGYPNTDAKGEVVDEPCLHRLGYTVNPASDRDKGMVKSMIESQRLYDFSLNKISEFAQIGLVPQMMAPIGAIKVPPTDEPASITEWDPATPGAAEPKWRETLGIPQELFKLREEALGEMRFIAHDNEVPSQVSANQAVQSILQQNEISWEDLIANMAEVYSRVARDCLTLVQRHYTEDRMLKFRGRAGYMPIEDFKGADLRDQTDVRVQPGSLTPLTRVAIEQRIQNIAQMFPGYFPPEVLLSAMNNGNAEGLLEGYEEDVGRINYIINQIRAGTFEQMGMRPVWPGEEPGPRLDPETGEPEWIQPPGSRPPQENPETGELIPDPGVPVMETEVPAWMPRPGVDNPKVWGAVLSNWCKSDEFAHLAPQQQEAAMQVFGALRDLEMREAQREQELQSQIAEQQGMANASRPQTKQAPSLAAVNGSSEEGPKGLPEGS